MGSGFDIGGIDLDILAGESNISSNTGTTIKAHNSTSYTKTHSLVIPLDGIYRVKFILRIGHTSATAFGRVYKNGIEHGSIRSTSSNSFVTMTEDLTFEAGDVLEIYTRTSGGYSVFAQPTMLGIESISTWVDA